MEFTFIENVASSLEWNILFILYMLYKTLRTLIPVIPILNFIGKCKTGTEVRTGRNPELSAERK